MRTLRARSPDPGWATDRRPRAHGNGDELCAKETGHGRGDRSPYCGMSTNRENIPWNATVMVSVGPLRCLATMRSASP